MNDANLAGDVTSVEYDLEITTPEIPGEIRTPFDLFFLNEMKDYDCYVEKVTKFIDFQIVEECDFVKPDAKQL